MRDIVSHIKDRQNYGSLYFNLYVFKVEKGKAEDSGPNELQNLVISLCDFH
jgi:hypothetical protein